MTSVTIGDVADALQALNVAREEESKARDNYAESGGYEWGYAGFSYTSQVEEATTEFGRVFDQYVEDRIEGVLRQKGLI